MLAVLTSNTWRNIIMNRVSGCDSDTDISIESSSLVLKEEFDVKGIPVDETKNRELDSQVASGNKRY